MIYEQLLEKVLTRGSFSEDRTGTGTLSLFGEKLEYDLAEGFPLITSKDVHFKSIVGELLWFLSGSTNANELKEKYGVKIWDEWAKPNGDLGPIYGSQWRNWDHLGTFQSDQIARLVENLQSNPSSRRHIVSAWNVSEIPHMELPPCHILFQANVRTDLFGYDYLDLQVYQRSADMFLGVPFNIASYALLTHMIAAQIGARPGKLHWVGGDVHIYANHVEQVKKQLKRSRRQLPELSLDLQPDIFSYSPDDIHLIGYNPHSAIKGDVAV